LRDYGIEPIIWDGEEGCEHKWGNKNITLKHKAGETNPGKEEWFKDRGASNDKGNYFCSKCGAWKGSLGLEPTFELYIKHLCDIFDQVKRVLRKDGTCWVNLGDSYGGSGNRSGHTLETSNLNRLTIGYGATEGNQKVTKGYAKSLLDIPHRFSIEMTNRGWIKRNTIIWHKPNCMPSSAKDRYTVDFEYIFFFTKNNKALFWTNEKTLKCVGKQPPGTKGIEGVDWEYNDIGKKISLWTGHDYWFEQQFDEYTKPLDRWGGNNLEAKNESEWDKGTGQKSYRDRNMRPNEQGRNRRAVWTINTKPFKEAHFAVFPETLIEPIIQAGCPRYVCKKCGKAREKIWEIKSGEGEGKPYNGHRPDGWIFDGRNRKSERTDKGLTDCHCNAGFEPGITLDPFMGAGTTAVVAKKQGKQYLGIELKQEYIDMANKRINKIPETLF